MRSQYGLRNWIMNKFAIDPFIRMLAKIAHAHAVSMSMTGYASFTPLLLDVIFSRTNTPSHWVGGDLEIPPAIDVVHQLTLDDDYRANGKRYVVATIRLFAFLGAPVFRVVVGERQD